MQDDFTQDDFTPRRRRWPYVLAVLAVVAAAGWSALWYFAAGRAEEVIAGWRAREARAGRIHTCGSQTVGGFPLRFEMRCTEPGLEVKSAGQPLSIKGKDVRVTANVWQPTRLTAEITGPLTVAEPGQPPTVTANWRHAQSELRGLPTAPEQVVLTFDRPVVERTAGGAVQRLFNAERLEITGRMLEGSARQNPVIEVVLNTVAAVAPTLHPLTQAPLDADVTAVLRGLKNFGPKPWADRFREIQAAGGRIGVSNARVKQGETIAAANGALGISPRGRPDGQLRVTVANLGGLLPALGLDGRSPPPANKSLDNAANRLDRIAPGLGGIARQNAAPALNAALNFIGQPTEIEGKRAVMLPLNFKDGAVTLGPIPLGQTGPLF
jgi:hypothetical protein